MCTGVRLRAKNGAVMYGRTLEFAQKTASKIIVIPRGYFFKGTVVAPYEPVAWKSDYAIVGVNMMDMIGLVDGVNDQGLAGGLFYFPDYAHYQEHDMHKNGIAPWELLTWILTTCATVKDVQVRLPDILVAPVIFEPWGIIPPIHAIVHDPSGKSIVIEYENGNLMIHESISGIITNSPGYQWHLTNLKNYINLTPNNVAAQALGQGSGMLGLPGDFTSPSRFVRATLFADATFEQQNEDLMRNLLLHLLKLFNIPVGVVREENKKEIFCDYTQWTSAIDLLNKRFYWHTYENGDLYYIDLFEAISGLKSPMTIPMSYPQQITKVSL